MAKFPKIHGCRHGSYLSRGPNGVLPIVPPPSVLPGSTSVAPLRVSSPSVPLQGLCPTPPCLSLCCLSRDPCRVAAVPAPSFPVPPGRGREPWPSNLPVPLHWLLGRDSYKGSGIWIATAFASSLKPPDEGRSRASFQRLAFRCPGAFPPKPPCFPGGSG